MKDGKHGLLLYVLLYVLVFVFKINKNHIKIIGIFRIVNDKSS